MTTRDKLQELLDIKQDIKESIENKDVDLTGVEFSGYAGKIDEIPSPKEEETKTISNADFSGGNLVVNPTANKVMTKVTVNKDANLVAGNIKSGVTVFGVAGDYEGEGGGGGLEALFVPLKFGATENEQWFAFEGLNDIKSDIYYWDKTTNDYVQIPQGGSGTWARKSNFWEPLFRYITYTVGEVTYYNLAYKVTMNNSCNITLVGFYENFGGEIVFKNYYQYGNEKIGLIETYWGMVILKNPAVKSNLENFKLVTVTYDDKTP